MRAEALTIPGLLRLRREADADVQAVVADAGAITYAQLDEASAALAARLVAAGVVKGDRVGLVAPNGVDWAVYAYAVLRIGAVLVPLSTLLRGPELLAQLTTASVSHLVAIEEFRGRSQLAELDGQAPGLRATIDEGGRDSRAPMLRAVWHLDGLPGAAAPEAIVRAMESRVSPADDLVVLFTSGSTGVPKGVIHTHGGAIRATAAGLDARCIRAGERMYVPMPFFWTGGFGSGLVSTLVAGATLLTEAQPDPPATLELLQRERVTLFRGWPDQAARIAAHPAFVDADLSRLGDGSLAALLPESRRPAPGARAGVFGMTESFGPYCGDSLDIDLPPAKAGSCGRPFEGVEVRVSDPDTGEEVPAGEQGEIWLRGPNLMRGICGRLASELLTRDGYYRTGDRGRMDADGYLFFEGRLDDMFKVKGASVFPSEVEAALRSLPTVRQAHVTEVTDSRGRAEVGALVVTEASLDEIRTQARQRLSAFKVPTRWLLAADPASVPTSATGKVDKSTLRDMLRSEET